MNEDYPKLKKRSFPNKKKKKNLLATWEDMDSSDNSDESDEEMVNICPMKNDEKSTDEVHSKFTICDSSESDDSESNNEDPPYDLLLEQSHMITLE